MERALNPKHVRYIKCGTNGAFWPAAFEQGWIPVGFCEVPFDLSQNGTRESVRDCLLVAGKAAKTATRYTTELMEFCHLPVGTVFVTFADRHLWWAEAAEEVIALNPEEHSGASRARRTRGGWSKLDLSGEALTMERLPTRITKTASYRMTICGFKEDECAMLLRRINGAPDPEVSALAAKQNELRTDLAAILRRLGWQDVEQLADLIFARSGWRRVTPLGLQEMDIDLIAEEPVFGTRAWVQVKTAATATTVRDYHSRFEADGSCDRFVFVCPELKGRSDAFNLPAGAEVWSGVILAGKVMEAGLTEWVFDRI